MRWTCISCFVTLNSLWYNQNSLEKTSIGPAFFGKSQMSVNWRDHIVSTPEILRGKPRIKGTRLPVSLIFGCFTAGISQKKSLLNFPISKTEVYACPDYARDLAAFEEVVWWNCGYLPIRLLILLSWINRKGHVNSFCSHIPLCKWNYYENHS